MMKMTNKMQNKLFAVLMLLLLGGFSISASAAAGASEPLAASNAAADSEHFADVMDQFNEERALAAERAISMKSKHQILFWMGGALLCLVLLAASFGVAMGVFDKDVFVWHVLSAGLATTLAVVHGVVAFVWFYPS